MSFYSRCKLSCFHDDIFVQKSVTYWCMTILIQSHYLNQEMQDSSWISDFRCAYCSFHKIGIIYLWPVPEQSPLPGRWLPRWPHRQPSGLHPPILWAPCWVRSKGAGCSVLAPTLLKVAMARQRKPLWLIRCGENKRKQEVFSLHVLKAKGVYFLLVNKNPVGGKGREK